MNMSTYQYPSSTMIGNKKFYWLELTSKTIDSSSQKAGPREEIAARSNDNDSTFKIAMPDEFAINLGHEWNRYESMTARMATVMEKFYAAKVQLYGGTKGLIGMWGGENGGINSNFFEQVLGSASNNENILYSRIDSPLVYKQSTPIEYNLAFKFSAYNKGEARMINDMVKQLMFLSCPAKKTGNRVLIEPPRLFEVKSYHNDSGSKTILNIKNAAMVQIQPTFGYPYIDGMATNIGLTMTLRDITPVFNESFGGATGSITASGLPKLTYPGERQ